jgi:hypothetical protein
MKSNRSFKSTALKPSNMVHRVNSYKPLKVSGSRFKTNVRSRDENIKINGNFYTKFSREYSKERPDNPQKLRAYKQEKTASNYSKKYSFGSINLLKLPRENGANRSNFKKEMLVNQMREVFTSNQKPYIDTRTPNNNHLKIIAERRQSALKSNKFLFSQTACIQSNSKVCYNSVNTKVKLDLLSKIVKNVGRRGKNNDIIEPVANINFSEIGGKKID